MPVPLAEPIHSSQVRGRTSSLADGGNHALAGSSPFKRQKVDHDVLPPAPQAPPRTPPRQIVSAMYSFASTKNSPVIDLTGASPSSSHSGSPIRANGGIRQTVPVRAPNGGPKKFVIKNLRPATRADPQEYFNQSWKRLDQALEGVFARNERPLLLEELYRSVENICRQGQAKLLFDKLHYRCRDHIKGSNVAGRLQGLVGQLDDVELLKKVLQSWTAWKSQTETVKLIFLYLNQSYLVSSKSDPTIDDLRTRLFRTHVFSTDPLRKHIVDGACDLVMRARQNDSSDSDFKDAVDMFHELKVYSSTFEPKFLSTSEYYFSKGSEHLVQSLDLAQYVAKVQQIFDLEKLRCQIFGLDNSTERDIRAQLDTFFIDRRLETLTDSHHVAELFEADDEKSLAQLYSLLQHKDRIADLRPAFEYYVKKSGEAIVFDEAKEQEMIPRLLAYKRKLDHIWNNIFKRQVDLGIGMREAFRSFMNKVKKTKMTHDTENEKTGEMIAKYVDALLRGGLKAVADDADGNEELDDDQKMNQQLDQVLELFRFLNGKAVFEAFYKKDLARRLLHKTSANDWAEKAMLQRLKDECGAAFTSNLESMFRDIETSRDENASFKSRQKTKGARGPDLEVNVLESSAWPSYPSASIVIPPQVEQTVNAFNDYYKQRFPSRKLEWKHTNAHCQLEAKFDKKYVIVVSAMQAVVLLYFNNKAAVSTKATTAATTTADATEQTTPTTAVEDPDDASDWVGFQELADATKLDEKNLVRTLQSLACARYKVLRKSTKGPEVRRSDSFAVNPRFRTDRVHFKINQIQLKETKEENRETHQRVAADREFETQAAIVRIMKSEQKIGHSQLITKVIEALSKRGVVQIEDVKRQIDKLIDKEYMERIEDNKYEYMA